MPVNKDGTIVYAEHKATSDFKVGDIVPMPPQKLDVRPASWADDPAASPKGVFQNGRSK